MRNTVGARRVEQSGKGYTPREQLSHVCGNCEACCQGAFRVMCGAMEAGGGEGLWEGRVGRGIRGVAGEPMQLFSEMCFSLFPWSTWSSSSMTR